MLKEAAHFVALGNGTLYTTLLRKLSQNLVVEYFSWTAEKKREESVETLTEWAFRESQFEVIATETKEGVNRSVSQKSCFIASDLMKEESCAKNSNPECSVCCEEHTILGCNEFLSMSYSERWNQANVFRLGFCCLVANHVGRFCKHM